MQQMYHELKGTGEKRILLLHGWGCSSATMSPLARDLQRSAQVLSVDFPGHGRTPNPPEVWGVPEYAEALKALLTELSFTPCAVIAHSFGARVAIYLASEYSGLFTQLLLTGAAGIRPKQSNEAKARQSGYQRMKQLAGTMRKVGFLKPAADRLQEAAVQKYGSADYKALSPEMRQTFSRIVNLDLTDRLGRIQQPTLLIWGEKDDATPLWMGQQMEKDIPDAGLVVFERGSHFAFLEQSARFLLIARNFFHLG